MDKNPDEDQSNLMALYGISLDGLGRFLYDIGKYNEALPSESTSLYVIPSFSYSRVNQGGGAN